MHIEKWLSEFKDYWIEKDINGVIWLFSDNIEYRENPYEKYTNREDIKKLWEYIDCQENIILNFDVFCSNEDKHSVYRQLKYDKDWISNEWRWSYLIKIGKDNKC